MYIFCTVFVNENLRRAQNNRMNFFKEYAAEQGIR